MRALVRGLIFFGVVAGTAAAVRNYLEHAKKSRTEVVQMVFGDGSALTLPASSVQAQEFRDIARKVLEISGH